jgi:hypothetical protein
MCDESCEYSWEGKLRTSRATAAATPPGEWFVVGYAADGGWFGESGHNVSTTIESQAEFWEGFVGEK